MSHIDNWQDYNDWCDVEDDYHQELADIKRNEESDSEDGREYEDGE